MPPATPTPVAPVVVAVKGQSTLQKVALTVLWVAVSASLGAFISLITQTPDLFGAYTPIINIVLVALKNIVDPNVPNI
jgi:hypothetical protein